MSISLTFLEVGTGVILFKRCKDAPPGPSEFFPHKSEIMADVLPTENHSSDLQLFTLLKCK